MALLGGCHCGLIKVGFQSRIDPWEIKARACRCSFCIKHGAVAISDPNGLLTINVTDREKLFVYMFGHHTAEFLICGQCGVYVAAVTADIPRKRGLLQVRTLDQHDLFTDQAVHVNFKGESKAERMARHQQVWMPVRLTLGETPLMN